MDTSSEHLVLKRLTELASSHGKSSNVRSSDVLKLLRALAVFDKNDIEAGIFTTLLAQTFIPLLRIFLEKDSDDARKVIRLLHYFVRRSLLSTTTFLMYQEEESKKALAETSFHSGYDDDDIFEMVSSTLTNMDIYPGQKVPEMNHKHTPRRMEALRTLATVFSVNKSVALQALITKQLMLNVEGSSTRVAGRKIGRSSLVGLPWKKDNDVEKWSMSLTVLGAAYQCLMCTGDKSTLLAPDTALPTVVRALASTNPATARYAASYLYQASRDSPEKIAQMMLNHLFPRSSLTTISTAPPERLVHDDDTATVRMLDIYAHLVQVLSDFHQRNQFYKAIVIVMCNDKRWRIRLHAARELAKAASVSWSRLQDCYVCANDEGQVFDIYMESEDANEDTQERIGMPMKLMYVLANMLSEALVMSSQYSGIRHDHHLQGGARHNYSASDSLDSRKLVGSTLLLHAVLRTVAAVGRQHVRYVFVANHSANLDQSHSGNIIHGTEALRASLVGEISKLTKSTVASLRLQAMLALLWLAPAPDEYNRTVEQDQTHALECFKRALFMTEVFPEEMANEFLRYFKERVRLSPAMASLILRWCHYPLAEKACTSNNMVALWKLCVQLNVHSRQEALLQIFSFLDGDHPAMADLNHRTKMQPHKLREFEELQKASIWFLGQYAYEITHAHSAQQDRKVKHSVEGLFKFETSAFEESTTVAEKSLSECSYISLVENKCLRSAILRIIRYSLFSSWHTKVVAMQALRSIACSKYATAITTLAIFDFFSSIKCFASSSPLNGVGWPLAYVFDGLEEVDTRLQTITHAVQMGKMWSPDKLDLTYPEAEDLKRQMIETSFGIMEQQLGHRAEEGTSSEVGNACSTTTNSDLAFDIFGMDPNTSVGSPVSVWSDHDWGNAFSPDPVAIEGGQPVKPISSKPMTPILLNPVTQAAPKPNLSSQSSPTTDLQSSNPFDAF